MQSTAPFNRFPHLDPWVILLLLISITMAVFGVMNGLELPLAWKDRIPQITRYLSAAGISTSLVHPALIITKSTEFILGVLAFIAMATRRWNLILWALAGWMIMFINFIAMDVIAADRAELTEHTIYQTVFAVMFATVIIAIRNSGSMKNTDLWPQNF